MLMLLQRERLTPKPWNGTTGAAAAGLCRNPAFAPCAAQRPVTWTLRSTISYVASISYVARTKRKLARASAPMMTNAMMWPATAFAEREDPSRAPLPSVLTVQTE